MSPAIIIIIVDALVWVGVTVMSAYAPVPAALRILGLITGAVFIFTTVFSMMRYLRSRTPADLWMVSFLGILGLLAFLPEVNNGLFGLFGLFGFLSYRSGSR